jgi:capsid protein
MNKLQATAAKWLGLSYLVDAANYQMRLRRPIEAPTVNTIAKEVNQSDWLTLLSDSRKLYCNLGPVTGAIDDKATYSIGRAWNPIYTGQDREWGKIAEKWLREEWYPMADARGSMFDFKTDLFLMSVCTDRDGEIYIFLTQSKDGWPQIQLLPAHMIGQRNVPDGILREGPYKGLRMIQGVVTNDVGRAVAYQILGEVAAADYFLSARDLIQVFDPRWPDQVRGFPVFMHALLDLKDLRTVQGYEKMAAQIMSSIGLIEWNEQGAPDPGDPMNLLTRGVTAQPNSLPSVTTQDFTGGTAHFFRSNSGSKLEGLKNDRPGIAVSEFMDRLIRNACVGAGWPYELTWDASKLGGANVRLLIAKAMRAVEDRQDLLLPVARRCVGYAVAKAIKEGILQPNDEWYAWRFTLPARMTADYGRQAAADLADYQAGITNLGDILAEEGKDLATHIKERAEENEMLREAGMLPETNGNGAVSTQPMPESPEPDDAAEVTVDANCPIETQDVKANLINRSQAIDIAHYGPANPLQPNDAYWQAKADQFKTTIAEAKTMRCGNCAGFNQSPRIKACIDAGIGADASEVEMAGDLGYCEVFDFKCAAKRTCDAWIVGGPITKDQPVDQTTLTK